MSVTVNEKLWLTADRERVVPDGHEDAAFLFATPGKEVSDEDAERYGIKAAPAPANKQADTPENKSEGGEAEPEEEAPAEEEVPAPPPEPEERPSSAKPEQATRARKTRKRS